MSWSEYQALGDNVRGEYIDGELVVSPSPTARHQNASSNLSVLLKAASPDGVNIHQAWAWKPGQDEFIPDLIVHDVTDENVRYTGTPYLCVDICRPTAAQTCCARIASAPRSVCLAIG